MRFDKLLQQKLIPLAADGRQRWAAVSPAKLGALVGDKWSWVDRAQDPLQRRTILTLGIDQDVAPVADPRPVALRTVFYRRADLSSTDAILRRRGVLSSQLRLLNQLQSPLLPEPLDWVEVENRSDPFPPGVPRWVVRSEPVLVLHWHPGFTLAFSLEKMPESWHIRRAARLARRLLRWLCFLDRHGIAWFNPHPSHILLPKNDVPRLLGLSGLCPVAENGGIDENHPGFLRTVKGYFPAEFATDDGGVAAARRSTPMHIGAFGLGVLLAQMAAIQPQLPPEWLNGGTFDARSEAWRQRLQIRDLGEREALVELVCRLCDPQPEARLVDAKEIRERLDPLAGDMLRYGGMIAKMRRNPVGELYGFIVADQQEEVVFPDDHWNGIYFNERALSEELRASPELEGMKVSFILRSHNGRESAQSIIVRG